MVLVGCWWWWWLASFLFYLECVECFLVAGSSRFALRSLSSLWAKFRLLSCESVCSSVVCLPPSFRWDGGKGVRRSLGPSQCGRHEGRRGAVLNWGFVPPLHVNPFHDMEYGVFLQIPFHLILCSTFYARHKNMMGFNI
jgi:hypothetical protein